MNIQEATAIELTDAVNAIHSPLFKGTILSGTQGCEALIDYSMAFLEPCIGGGCFFVVKRRVNGEGNRPDYIAEGAPKCATTVYTTSRRGRQRLVIG